MENLKKLLGAEYKEGISLEEVDAFIGKGKFVNLNEGNYVDKDKYSKVVADRDNIKNTLNELTEKTKDYDDIKKSNETFKLEKADAELKAKGNSLIHKYKGSDSNYPDKVLKFVRLFSLINSLEELFRKDVDSKIKRDNYSNKITKYIDDLSSFELNNSRTTVLRFSRLFSSVTLNVYAITSFLSSE